MEILFQFLREILAQFLFEILTDALGTALVQFIFFQ